MKEEDDLYEHAIVDRPARINGHLIPQNTTFSHRVVFWIWLIAGSLLFLGSLFPSPYTTAINTLEVDESSASWTMIANDGLQLFAYFSEDLGGSAKSTIPHDWPVEKCIYSFSPVGMCRFKDSDSDFDCYRGRGMDIPSMLVLDLGTQVGLIGEVENPQEFGTNTQGLYQAALKEVNRVIRQIQQSEDSANLDPGKVLVMLQLEKVSELALAIQTLWIVAAFNFLAVVIFDFLSFIFNGNARRVFEVMSLILQGSLFVILLILLCGHGVGSPFIEAYLHDYGLHWSLGITTVLLAFHTLLTGIYCILTWSYIV